MLLDTHPLYWWMTGQTRRLTRAQNRVIDHATDHAPLLVSPLSMFEIANLVRQGRVGVSIDRLQGLLEAIAAAPVTQLDLTTDEALMAMRVPESITDPIDRMLCGTARYLEVPLITSDRAIIGAAWVETVS